jgi:bifunctional non-homologous end joining protein LigD
MNAVSGELPADDGHWAFEPKWDGMRAQVRLDDGVLHLRSRSGRPVTGEFPELGGLVGLADRAVLDGEVVAIGEDGRTSFSLLQRRFGLSSNEAQSRSLVVPAFYVVFDVLHLEGSDTWSLPFRERRELLEGLVTEGPTWRITPSGRGGGTAWLEAARAQRLEGVIAKRLESPYRPGRRSADWRKIKIRHAQEFVVCGWTPGAGSRDASDAIGALVLGCEDPVGLRWVGNVGSGMSREDLRWWRREVEETARYRSPFARTTTHPALRGARWVEPTRVVQVAYAEWTGDRRLRQPSLLGLRDDVAADAVRCEE